jgi:hypothetical protein
MPVNTGPSFMSRLGQAAPGALNAAAQQFGNPSMAGGVKASAGLLGRQKQPMRRQMPVGPRVTSGIPAGQMPGQRIQAPGLQVSPEMGGMRPELNAEMPMGGINTAPSPQLFAKPYANIFGGTSGYGPSGNTGVAGGLFNRPPGYERPNMGAPGADIGGMFSTYNRMPQVRY